VILFGFNAMWHIRSVVALSCVGG